VTAPRSRTPPARSSTVAGTPLEARRSAARATPCCTNRLPVDRACQRRAVYGTPALTRAPRAAGASHGVTCRCRPRGRSVAGLSRRLCWLLKYAWRATRRAARSSGSPRGSSSSGGR
jgi:hypothetical protein